MLGKSGNRLRFLGVGKLSGWRYALHLRKRVGLRMMGTPNPAEKDLLFGCGKA